MSIEKDITLEGLISVSRYSPVTVGISCVLCDIVIGEKGKQSSIKKLERSNDGSGTVSVFPP